MAAQRDLLIKFLGDSKGLTRAARDAISSLDDTATASDKVAAALDAMAADMKANMQSSAAATEALAAAMGGELVAEITAAGGSVDRLVADLHRAGLTYDEIASGASQLAGSIRNVGDAAKSMGDDLESGAERADDGLRKVHDSGDQSRSVLANLVGNSAQDLGELGGVAGTAGVAIGQLAEYAAEGNINLQNLGKVAGPMAAIGAAVAGVTWVFGQMKKESEEAKKETEALLKVQQKLRDGKFADAAADLADYYKDTIPLLQKYGFGLGDVARQMQGQADILPTLQSRLAAVKDELRDTTNKSGDHWNALLQEQTELQALVKTLGEVRPRYADATAEIENTANATADAEAALRSMGAAATTTATSVARVDRSARDFKDSIAEAADETRRMDEAYRSLTGNLDARAAWRNLQDSLDQTKELIDSGEASWRDLEAQVDDNVAKARDFIKATDDIPDEVKTDLYAKLDQGELDTVLAIIDQLRQGVDVPVRFRGQNQVGFDRSDLDGKQKDPKVKGNSLRMSAKSATVSQPAAASAPVLLGGGITRTVTTRGGGGGGNADDRRMAAMAEVGDISQDEYKAYLQGRLGEFEKYSDDYMRVWRQINSIDRQQQREADDAAREAQRIADEQARQLAADEAAKKKAADDEIARTDQIMAAMYELGAISLEQYRDYLNGRLGAYEQFSAQFMAIWRQLQALDGAGTGSGKAATADEVRLAELEAQRLQYIADQYGLDPKRTEEERLKARIDAANAAARLAQLRNSMTSSSNTANTSTVNINMPPGSNGNDVVRAIQDYERRNGKSWRN